MSRPRVWQTPDEPGPARAHGTWGESHRLSIPPVPGRPAIDLEHRYVTVDRSVRARGAAGRPRRSAHRVRGGRSGAAARRLEPLPRDHGRRGAGRVRRCVHRRKQPSRQRPPHGRTPRCSGHAPDGVHGCCRGRRVEPPPRRHPPASEARPSRTSARRSGFSTIGKCPPAMAIGSTPSTSRATNCSHSTVKNSSSVV